jgi:hypothetical protein
MKTSPAERGVFIADTLLLSSRGLEGWVEVACGRHFVRKRIPHDVTSKRDDGLDDEDAGDCHQAEASDDRNAEHRTDLAAEVDSADKQHRDRVIDHDQSPNLWVDRLTDRLQEQVSSDPMQYEPAVHAVDHDGHQHT